MAGYNNFVGYGYPNNMAYGNQMMSNGMPNYQQAQNNFQPQQQKVGIEWVDGEVGAKAFQLPPGWPANVPMPLWDTNDTVIYLKSINQMGMPNPLQKVHYTMDHATQSNQSMLPAGDNVTSNQSMAQDMSNYVTKDDMKRMEEELKAAINAVKGAEWHG